MNRQGLLILLISAAAFSTLAIFMKMAYATGVNLTTLLAFRFLFSSALCFTFSVISGKSLTVPMSYRWRLFALGGVAHVAVSALYALSVQRLPASLTGLIFYLYPAMVTGLAVLIGWERMNRLKLAALVVCFVGLLQVMGVSVDFVSTTGLIAGVAAAFFQACHVLLSHAIITDLSPLLTVGWSALATSSVFFAYGGLAGELQLTLSPLAWGSIFGTAFFANFIGIVMFFSGMRLVGPSDASIVMNLEPVLTVALAMLLLGESFSWAQAAGGCIILGGLYILHQGESVG